MMVTQNQRGFTLLELLVVITVLGLLLVALTNGVRFAGQAWEIQQRRSERQGDLDAVQNVLRQLIVSGTNFEGNERSLRFVGTLPAALGRGGLYDIELSAASGDLALAWKPRFKGPSANQTETQTVLARNVATFELGYYRAPGGWRAATDDKAVPPALIRIALKVPNARSLAPLVIAPAVDVVPPFAK